MKVSKEGKSRPLGLTFLGWDPTADTGDTEPQPDRAYDIPTYGPAIPTVAALTTAPDGGWSHIQDPRALYLPAVDHTVFGYVDGTSGDVKVRTFDNTDATVGSAFVLKAAVGGFEGNPDWHDNPAIIRRASDGKLLAVYGPHSGAAVYRRISSNADDATAWAAETNLDASIGGTDYTYPTLVELTAENTIYLFIRDGMTTATTSLIYSTSTDGGSTWSAKTVVFSGLTSRDPYWKIATNGVDRVDIFTTDASMPNDPGTVKTGHFYFTGGAFFKTDGTSMGSPPYDFTDITEVYDGSDGRGWPVDAITVTGEEPRLLEQITDSGETFDIIREFRYDGAAWVGVDVIPDVGSKPLSSAVYDHADPSTVYATLKVSTQQEMFLWSTEDDGATWTGTPLTVASSDNNGTPSAVFNRSPASLLNDLAVIWFHGTWVDYLDFDLGIKGLISFARALQGLTTDDDDATYDLIDEGTDVLRIDLGTTYRIVRSRLFIGSELSGSRTYNIYGATIADFSDEVLLDSATFTATGSYTGQQVLLSWSDDGIARQFFRLEGTDESRRVYSFELYEASSNLADYATLTDLEAVSDVIDDHIVDPADAHDASSVSVVPFASIAATDVQAALEEIVAEASTPSGHYELLMAAGSSPIEPLETGDGLDWLYVWIP